MLLLFVSNSYAVSIIVNESVSSSPASVKELRNIFTLQKRYWENGTKIHIFVFPDDDPLHRQFSKTVTKIFPHQYRRIWDRITFSGTGVAPITVYNLSEMLEKVGQTKNSIGYIEQPVDQQNIKIIDPELFQGNLNE
ncbi:MAG: hypothetical protein KZQ83_14320 [gamma proteobacterium symbiont of Taylorina sp.]|nr:hypothetical protein [gamma proteobacterium symbiont of Taylorina sp.]